MSEPLFPIKSRASLPSGSVLTIEPYRHEGVWVFDDPAAGLHREPFVSGITQMIDRLAAGISNSAAGFRLHFAAAPFAGYQAALTWLRSDPVEGNWYRAEEGDEGWLCPALFCYFATPPAQIFVRAEPNATAASSNRE